jgi:MoaA/NifB/PqqE/SkfB family radical SAM enzyme
MGWKYLSPDDRQTILRGLRDGVAYGGPYHVEIYPADRCNIECFFCSTASLRGTDELPLTRMEELLAELQKAGTRSIRLSGGGEPLFHRQTKVYLRAIASSGIPIENITTNAVLMGEEVAELLIDAHCDQVTVSLNTADAETYASMMKTPPRNFERVLANVKGLVAAKRRRGTAYPQINIQYLVWRDNYRSIPRMYALARELGADTVLFNGLSHLKAHQKMSTDETAEMMRLYEEVIRIDEYRTIMSISSYEQDISAALGEITARIHHERARESRLVRYRNLLARRDFTLRQKLLHRTKMRRVRRVNAEVENLSEECVIGWYSLVIRTNGAVAPCCILQGQQLGNIYAQSLDDVWYGPGFSQLRRELAEIIDQGENWKYDPERHRYVNGQCAVAGSQGCPIRSFYYRQDLPFMRRFAETVDDRRRAVS